MSDLTPPTFGNGTLAQCKPITVSWEGGVFPVRVEAFFQSDPESDWKSTGTTPADSADSNIIEWTPNVPAGSIAWITLVDHSGTYKQSSYGTVVAESDDASCLDNSQTAAVVTQTVFMNSGGKVGTGLDDRSLLILAVVFGLLFFSCAAGMVYLFSKLRQTRRLKGGRGQRFAMTNEDFDSVFSRESAGDSLQQGPEYGTGYNAVAAVGSRRNSAAGTSQAHERHGTHSSNESGGRRMSRINENASWDTAAMAAGNAEKGPRSPASLRSEHNPFLDPPLAGTATDGKRQQAGIGSATSNSGIHYPSLDYPSHTTQRPPFIQQRSRADTNSSATSMQLFNTNAIGGLRIANDPRNISTPQLSRVNTINTLSSETSSQYPASQSDGRSPTSGNSDGDGAAAHLIDHASGRPATLSSSRSIGDRSFISSTSATGSTADHYASEPHSSKGHLITSTAPKK